MEYLVSSCITYEDHIIKPVCGGWCCYLLDFRQFPHGRWYAQPCTSLQNGLCNAYEERPRACLGAPFFDGGPAYYPADKFPLPPWCCYRREVLEIHGVPFLILESGAACIDAYSKEKDWSFTRWWERKFYLQGPSIVIEE